MADLVVRALGQDDLDVIANLDHNYHTEYVWQMDIQSGDRDFNVRFREVRLPRSMPVTYPYPIESIIEDWRNSRGVLVAENGGEVVGYLSMKKGESMGMVSVTGVAVQRRMRRQGVGSALLLAGETWAIQQGGDRMQLEMQSKNYPGISLASKLGFEFCGYNDKYYDNQDIALFFVKRI